MKTINTISETLGYTIDTYGMFNPDYYIDDDDWTDDTDFDHIAYVAELSNYCAEVIERACGYDFVKFKCRVSATGSFSPREYNFKTDNGELLIEFDDAKVLKYIKAHQDTFNEYLKNKFTSYDGFWSFVANNWPEFIAEMDNSTEEHDRNWAIMLGWFLHHSEILTEDDYIDQMHEHASEAAYNCATNLRQEV